MNELITLSLKHFSDFVRTFINLVASPSQFPHSANLFSNEKFEQGMLFFGISLVVSLVIKTPFRPPGVDVWLYLAMDGVWKILFVITLSIAMSIAWLGRPGRYYNYFVANCYFGGVLFVLIPLYFIIIEQAGKVFLGYAFFFYGYALLLLIWCVGVWYSYAKYNEAKPLEAFLRFLIAFVLVPSLGVISIFIRGGTVIDAVAKAGGNDYAELDKFFLIPTLGMFP